MTGTNDVSEEVTVTESGCSLHSDVGRMKKRPAEAVVFKWRGQDSNLRPRGYEPRELPGCSTARRCDLHSIGKAEDRRPLKGGKSVYLNESDTLRTTCDVPRNCSAL